MLRTSILWLIVSLFSFPVIVLAQDATATSESIRDDFYHWSATVYFPQAVEFEVVVLHDAVDISQLTLTIQYDVNEDPIQIDVDPTIGTVTTPYVSTSYFWNISANSLPTIFTPIRYTWKVVTLDGHTANFTDLVIFEDTRVDWEISADPIGAVNLHYAKNLLNADALRQGLRGVYGLLYPGNQNRKSYEVLVYPQDVPVGCARNSDDEPVYFYGQGKNAEERSCNMTLANRIFANSQMLVFQLQNIETLRKDLSDRMVADVYQVRWQGIDVPAWFLRGLQLFYNPTNKVNELSTAQRAARANALLSYSSLAKQPDDPQKQELWDAESIGLILYMADTIGVDKLFEFANTLADYESFDAAYSAFIDQTPDVLLLAWADWIFKSSAPMDYAYNPYLPDTPTPTATVTATFTPTPTFTPSKTPPITPSFTPTRTPIPPTATRTPLPAQSFSLVGTDTPEPNLATPASNTRSISPSGIALIIGGAGILILLVLFFGLRRR